MISFTYKKHVSIIPEKWGALKQKNHKKGSKNLLVFIILWDVLISLSLFKSFDVKFTNEIVNIKHFQEYLTNTIFWIQSEICIIWSILICFNSQT